MSPDADGPTASVAAVVKKKHPHKAGCSDGTREGFVDTSTWPDIAGCSGAWTIPGLHTDNPGIAPACPGLPTFDTTTPACHRKAGNDGKNCEGQGCDVADLCARGWHVCTGAKEVTAKSATGCVGATSTGEPLFFATRQSSNGCDQCADGTLVGPACNSETCVPGCLQTANTSNDFFGCGNFGSPTSCAPLDKFSQNLCSGLAGSSWSCDDPTTTADDNGLCEAYTAVKSDSAFGGVLCCRDEHGCPASGERDCDDDACHESEGHARGG